MRKVSWCDQECARADTTPGHDARSNSRSRDRESLRPYDLQLTTSATGTGWERTLWRATQRAAWEALTKTD
jgi:hypothetical protein